jgi:4,5:9,10-diseco-3-hydroxy-5,9,17-trioxoandrosta-1(10),2-diene-4-oate hydrolase
LSYLEHCTIDVAGVKTFYVRGGSGPPIVFIHGGSPGACSLVSWQLNLDAFAGAGFSVYAYDQPGFGLSGIPTDHTLEFRVTHAAAFLAAIAPDHVHLVASSMGAYIAARLALDHAGVDRLALISSSTLAPKGSAKSAARADAHGDELRGYVPSLEAMREMTRKTLFRQALVTDELVRQRYEMSMGPLFDASKARATVRGFRSLEGELHRLRNPTMLLWGLNDRGASVERAVLLLEALAGAELHVFNDCAHWVQWDQADRFNQLVVDFLRGTPKT